MRIAKLDRPSRYRLLSRREKNKTPSAVPRTVPRPPNRLVPPITAPPTTSSKMRWPRMGEPVCTRAVKRTDAIAAHSPHAA